MRKRISLLTCLMLVCLLVAAPLSAFAATRYVYYSGSSLSDQQIISMFKGLYPKDQIVVVRKNQTKPQPQPQPQPQPASQPPVQGLTRDEQTMVNLVNQERIKAGLAPLTIDYTLVKLARMKSQDMIAKGYFGHISPTYGSPFDMMTKAGVTYRTAGENIAGAQTVEMAHTNLMNSPGHRANILNPNYTRIGIGIIDGGPYGKMFTQMFIG